MLKTFSYGLFILFNTLVLSTQAIQLQHVLAVEGRGFLDSPLFPEQHHSLLSLSLQSEFYQEWNRGEKSITFTPFYRYETADKNRRHFDIRELKWLQSGDGWEFRIGIDKTFWGVTESVHLVDIINQTDLVENIDGEQKLGQPLVKFSLEKEWGTLDLFVMPWFRERRYPSKTGRFRTPIPIDFNEAIYQSSREQRHVDVALRWSHSVGDWDFALSHFYGTNRDPNFIFNRQKNNLIPYYGLINQTGLELQATLGDWLLKFEGIYRRPSSQTPFANEDYLSMVSGFEYTLYGFLGTDGDLGVIAELIIDGRGSHASNPLNKELFMGFRWAANNTIATEGITGIIQDLEGQSSLFNLEITQRLSDSVKLSLQTRVWFKVDKKDPLYSFNQDDYIELKLEWFF